MKLLQLFQQLVKNLYFKNIYKFLLIGFNVETVEYKNISFTVWDVGGQVNKIFVFPN